MSLPEFQHQDRALGLLERALSADRLPHAYIFHGPDGVGKETCATWLAGVLLCHQTSVSRDANDRPVHRACGRCNDCQTVRAGTHPDLHVVHPKLIKYHEDAKVRRRKGIDLGVDVVRQFVINQVGHKPVQGRAKVFIIRQADRITPQAQNALLKTLEEPPATTFIILLVSSLDRLLATTHSRCQLIPFGVLPVEFITAELTRLMPDLDADRAELVAKLTEGSLGVALQYAQDGLADYSRRMCDTLSEISTKAVADVVEGWQQDAKALGAKFRQRDPDITETEAERRGLKTLLSLAALWYRDVLHGHYGPSASPAPLVPRSGRSVSAGQAVAAIQHLADSQSHIDANVNLKLCLDNTVIRLAKLAG